MTFKVRFTEEAQTDLDRLYGFMLERGDGGEAAGRALEAITRGVALLQTSPFACRRAMPGHPFLRELVIGFGSTGYVALFEIEDSVTVTVLALRHQREDDYA